MNNSSMIKPALVGGIALGILSTIPVINTLNCACCAWVIGGGILAANMYIKESSTTVTLGRGAGLGIITGIIGAVVSLLFSIPMQFLLNRGGAATTKYLQDLLSSNLDLPPEVQQTIEELTTRSDLNTLLLVVGFISNLILFSLFAMIGGAIGVAIFEKRKPGNQPPDTIPPPITLE